MRKLYIILFLVMLVCIGCEWHLRPEDANGSDHVQIERYDRMEELYLTTGDYAALQQMNTGYPQETRMLIEDMLQLGKVDAPDYKARFFHFFQDTTLQRLIAEVSLQYADMSDLNQQLTDAFRRLRELLPSVATPRVYAQIGSLNQSIVVGDSTLGISLDKYLGDSYPAYLKYGYTKQQRAMMTRQYIVPDALGFYLLSLYPMPEGAQPLTRDERDRHMGKIQYVVNQALGRDLFQNEHVQQAARQLKDNKGLTIEQLLQSPAALPAP